MSKEQIIQNGREGGKTQALLDAMKKDPATVAYFRERWNRAQAMGRQNSPMSREACRAMAGLARVTTHVGPVAVPGTLGANIFGECPEKFTGEMLETVRGACKETHSIFDPR